MWLLKLNPITGRCEERVTVFRAETREELEKYLESQKVPVYTDTSGGGYGHEANQGYQFHKRFKRGGPLEWYNEATPDCFVDVGTLALHLGEAQKQVTTSWNDLLMRVPLVPPA